MPGTKPTPPDRLLDQPTISGTSTLNDPRDLRRLRHALPSPARLIHSPGSLPPAFAVTVIGDVRVDVRAHLPDRRFTDLTSDEHRITAVTSHVGGTAMSFARAATPHFAQVQMIGTMGSDSWSDFIQHQCRTDGIDSYLVEVDQPNGLVIVLRDQGTAENPDGVRLVIAAEESPYGQLDVAKIRSCAELITGTDALVIDGYALLEESSAEALDLAVDLAVGAGVPVCFDVVPHRIDLYLTLDDLRSFLHRSSLISIEAHTLFRLLGLPVPDTISAAIAADLIDRLPRDLAGWQRTWLIRYGYGNMDQTTAISANHHQVTYDTGYSTAATTAGYGYVVGAAELKWWLTNYSRAAALYPQLADSGGLVSASWLRRTAHDRP